MVTKNFTDSHGNELKLYINSDEKIYLSCGDFNSDFMYEGYICLDKEDAKELVKELQRLIKQMPNE